MVQVTSEIYRGAEQGYVLCIAVAPLTSKVVLIRKNRPAWQAGRLNFPGGKIEPGESPVEAAKREFFEETGVELPETAFTPFVRLSRLGQFNIFGFYVERDEVEHCRSMTDEPILLIKTHKLPKLVQSGLALENLSWILEMARDKSPRFSSVLYD